MFIGMALALAWAQTSIAGDQFHLWQKDQHQRIYSGIHHGQITPKEFYRLNKEKRQNYPISTAGQGRRFDRQA
jgi:hypothetical protein